MCRAGTSLRMLLRILARSFWASDLGSLPCMGICICVPRRVHTADGMIAKALQSKSRPIVGHGLFSVRSKDFTLGARKRTGDCGLCRQARVKALHQVRRKYVVCAPKSGNNIPCAGEKERLGDVSNTLLPLESPNRRITSGQNYDFCVGVQLHDFERLQDAVFAGCWVAEQHEGSTIWMFFIGNPVDRQVNNLKLIQLRVFER